jgi:pimeloyl-ACP methyl ester carboxylesterase
LILAWFFLGSEFAVASPFQPLGRFPFKPPAKAATPAAADPVATRFVQVYPAPREELTFRRSRDQVRAAVLVHGFQPHPFKSSNVNKANYQGWQIAGCPLVEALAHAADVYAFAYSQNVGVQEIAGVACLADNVRRLAGLGYHDIVLVGHSAGGLVARQFVEDYPDGGVTKVVQVCAPNQGLGIARFEAGVPKVQRVFLHSLNKTARATFLKDRASVKIPAALQFVCIIGDGVGSGDFIVACESQWPRDLQDQGIPALLVRTTHFTVMRLPAGIERVVEAVRDSQPRWNAERIDKLRKELPKHLTAH